MSLKTIEHFTEKRCLQKIAAIQSKALYRSRIPMSRLKGAEVYDQNQSYITFNSNDYLGLSQHPKVIAALRSGAEAHGVGSGGSPLLGGYHPAHEALEAELAEFLETPRVLLFSTGYAANLSVLTSLIHPTDALLQDRLNHASLIDAGRYSQARFNRYHHRDLEDLVSRLESSSTDQRWIVTDGVFSVDGDIAPLAQLTQISSQYQTALIVDDAHGIGILGPSGKGTVHHENVPPHAVTLTTGSFGIAFGTFGAFVAGSETLIEMLIQSARGYIYTTAFPPAIAEATRTSLQLLQEADNQRTYLKDLIRYFQTCTNQLNLTTLPSETPIQPILIGDNETTLLLANALQTSGFLVGAIRPPTVPNNTARLRITLTIHHKKSHIDQLLSTLATLLSTYRK